MNTQPGPAGPGRSRPPTRREAERQACDRKERFVRWDLARKAARRVKHAHTHQRIYIEPFRCRICGGFPRGNPAGAETDNQGAYEMKPGDVSDHELFQAIERMEAAMSAEDRALYDAKNALINAHTETLITAAAMMTEVSARLITICGCSQCHSRSMGLSIGADSLLIEVLIASRLPSRELARLTKERVTLLKAPVTM